jgi:5-methylthioribose kinase
MTPQEVGEWAEDNLDFEPTGAVRMKRGLLNEVWRIDGDTTAILKVYTDKSTENSTVELTRERGRFEAAALKLFEYDHELKRFFQNKIEVPRLLRFNELEGTLAMTHLEHQCDFGEALVDGTAGDQEATRLGTWLGGLHRESRHRMDLLRRFKNVAVQRTRLRIQYAAVEDTLEEADIEVEATRLREAGRRALALGRKLLEPGDCLIMGDLWPRSVLIGGERIGVIDWEFCHYGRPLQDVAHLAAHLWLLADGSDDRLTSVRIHNARSAFLDAYFRAAQAWDEDEREWANVHAGAEIVMRTYGAFADVDLFAEPGHRGAAAARGIDAMMGDWSPLRP